MAFDKAYWDDHYQGHSTAAGHPSPHLVDAVAGLRPGRALDAGCGEGADAVWLAARGWRVAAVDIASPALARAAALSDQVEWIEADLTAWTPPERHFDLVTSHYVHTSASREDLVRRLAAAVAPGGVLLIVGHHPSDPHAAARPHAAHVHVTADEVAACLDPDEWTIDVADTRTRAHARHGVTLRDAVLLARRG